jgi:hypothetical protein
MHAPDLVAVKDFVRFYIATSRGKIVEKPTADSVNSFLEPVFAGFIHITGAPTDEEDRSEVYNVSALPLGRGGSNLTITSGSENAHCRGSGGEYKEAETQFLRNRSHASSSHPLGLIPL